VQPRDLFSPVTGDEEFEEILTGFNRLNMSGERYNLERDQTVDDETKRRLRGKLRACSCCSPSFALSHSNDACFVSPDNNFDETITLSTAMVASPFVRRCGISFTPLKNHHDTTMNNLADGTILSFTAPEVDIVHTAAYVIGKYEVAIKTIAMSYNHLHGGYSGKFIQSYGTAHSFLLDPEHSYRLFHYILVKFPSTHPVENLFSVNTAGAAIDPKISWYAPPPGQPAASATSDVHWPVALSNTKVRFQMLTPLPTDETPLQRAMREARDTARRGNLFHSNMS
jgi:hypothetical protein